MNYNRGILFMMISLLLISLLFCSIYPVKADPTWTIETVDTTGDVGWDCSLVLDSAGNPHISYYDQAPNLDLKYAWWSGSAWSIETVDSEGSVGWDCSLGLDSAGNPHISYWDSNNGDLKYAYGEYHTPTQTPSITSSTPTEPVPSNASDNLNDDLVVALALLAVVFSVVAVISLLIYVRYLKRSIKPASNIIKN